MELTEKHKGFWGILRDDTGAFSSIRVMSLLILIFGMLLMLGDAFGIFTSDNMTNYVLYSLSCAFAPKVFQKFAEGIMGRVKMRFERD